MARINKITCLMGKTINLGNYESARADYGEEVLLEPDDDVAEVATRTMNNCRGGLAEAIERMGLPPRRSK